VSVPATTPSSRIARRTVAPFRTTTPGSSTESTTLAPASTTTPGDSTDPDTDPDTRAPPQQAVLDLGAPRQPRRAALAGVHRPGGIVRPERGCLGQENSRWTCQYVCTVPTSRQ